MPAAASFRSFARSRCLRFLMASAFTSDSGSRAGPGSDAGLGMRPASIVIAQASDRREKRGTVPLALFSAATKRARNSYLAFCGR